MVLERFERNQPEGVPSRSSGRKLCGGVGTGDEAVATAISQVFGERGVLVDVVTVQNEENISIVSFSVTLSRKSPPRSGWGCRRQTGGRKDSHSSVGGIRLGLEPEVVVELDPHDIVALAPGIGASRGDQSQRNQGNESKAHHD